MRIVLVSGHFSPDIGYQEVQLAKAYARAGHDVRVLTTTYVPGRVMASKPRTYRAGTSREDGYEIVRLKIAARVGSTLLPLGMRRAIRDFRPDLIIGVGIAKFMPVLAARWKRGGGYKLISIFGDAYKHRDPSSPALRDRAVALARSLAFTTIKRRWYRYVIARSDRVVVTTPEAEEIIRNRFNAGDDGRDRLRFVPLGYDEDLFFYDDAERERTRREHGIAPEDVVLVTATKIEPSKRLEPVLELYEALAATEPRLRWLVIGFGRTPYSDRLRERIARSPARERIHCARFLEAEELRAHYNAADIGVWTRETITIQEAMGTGLPVLLPRTDALSHLVRDDNGRLWGSHSELARELGDACARLAASPDRSSERRALAEANRDLSYTVLAERIAAGAAG